MLPTQPPVDSESPGASRGQTIIMFALFLTAMIGVLGLATDLGVAFAQRRTMQNAADAGALAGARAVARWTSAVPTTATTDVTAMVAVNKMNTTPSVQSCVYVNYANVSQGACTGTVPAGATGVRVQVAEQHATFFVRVVPGAPELVTVRATATAHVQTLAGFPSDSPFIVCGSHSWAVKKVDGTTYPGFGQDVPILLDDDSPQLNPAAVGVTFRIHDNQISQTTGIRKASGCKAQSARFNGVTDQPSNAGKEADQWFNYVEGTAAGPTLTAVEGIQGCKVGQTYDCVMLIPIATDDPAEASNNKELYIVGYAAFYVTRNDVNSHNGRLLEDFLITGPSDENWCRNCNSGAAVIRLTG